VESTVPSVRLPREPIVPLRYPRHEIPPVTRVRSTALHSTLRALETRGLLSRYGENLPDGLRATVMSVVPAMWIDVSLAVAHYAAVDALCIPVSEQIAIGTSAGGSAQRFLTATLLRMSREAGVTPWAVMPHTHRLWDRMCEGGDISVDRVGPKEAILTMRGLPYARSQYFRVAARAGFQAGLSHWCLRCYVTEVSCSDTVLELREAWA
jgi:hypothetical protein